MPAARRLLRLYPRAWRERYGEEFLATVGGSKLHLQQVIDIVSGAIDAWLSAEVHDATRVHGVATKGAGPMWLKSMAICESPKTRYTKRDGLIGAGVMIVGSLALTALGIAARRGGWPEMGKALTGIAFPISLQLSMPFWLMKGQPWKAQVVIVGGTVAVLLAFGFLSTKI